MSLIVSTERLILRTSDTDYTENILEYFKSNRTYFEKYEPAHPDIYYTPESMRDTLDREIKQIERGLCFYYYVSTKSDPSKIIGSIAFVRIKKEPYASTEFGYDFDESVQGLGYATESCKAAIENVLKYHHIHRFESWVLPDNEKSIRLLKRLGFEYEGPLKGYMLLEGVFRDHERYTLINENY